jgi:hypothetical protein
MQNVLLNHWSEQSLSELAVRWEQGVAVAPHGVTECHDNDVHAVLYQPIFQIIWIVELLSFPQSTVHKYDTIIFAWLDSSLFLWLIFFVMVQAKWCREPQQPKSTRMYGCHSYVLCHTSILGRKGEVLCPSGDKANFAASRHGFGEETTNGKAFLGVTIPKGHMFPRMDFPCLWNIRSMCRYI